MLSVTVPSAGTHVDAATPFLSNTATIRKSAVLGAIALSSIFLFEPAQSPSDTAVRINIKPYAPFADFAPREDVQLKALTTIRELGAYEDGWNGPNTQGPNQTAVDNAETFLLTLDLMKTKPPFITLTDDGEIDFIWKSPTVTLDLGFFGDGTYSYFSRANGRTYRGDDILASEPLPPEVLELLRIAA